MMTMGLKSMAFYMSHFIFSFGKNAILLSIIAIFFSLNLQVNFFNFIIIKMR